MSASLSFDIDVGSPLKGHHMSSSNMAAGASVLGQRAPFGDMTNNNSASNNQLTVKPPTSWGITSKNKAGELGMETFKKFLEKKRSNSVGGGAIITKGGKTARALPPPPSSHQQHQSSANSNSMVTSLDLAMTTIGDMAMKSIVGSPDHRIQVQNAETVKSPWSYQLQVPLWPLNMKLGISVEEENEDEISEGNSNGNGNRERGAQGGNALRDQFHDGTYMREKLFSAYDLTDLTAENAQQPQATKANTGWKMPSKSAKKESQEGEEEVKLPTPTLLAKQKDNNNKSFPSLGQVSIAVVDEENVVGGEQEKVVQIQDTSSEQATLLPFDVESQAGFVSSSTQDDDTIGGQKLDLDSVPLFAVEKEQEEETKEEESTKVDNTTSGAPHVDIEMAPPVQILAVKSPEVVLLREEVVLNESAPVDTTTVVVELPSQHDEPEEKAVVEEVVEQRSSQPPPPPPRRARSESQTFVNPLVHQFCATPVKDSSVVAKKTEEETAVVEGTITSVKAAGRIANAFRLHMFGKVMGVMAQLRDNKEKLISLSGGTTGSSYQDLHSKYESISESVVTSSTNVSSCIAGALRLNGEMEQAIQALVDSNEKKRRYQKRLERQQRLEKAAVTVQRMWREKKKASAAVAKRNSEVILSVQMTIAASKIQNAWRKHNEVAASTLQSPKEATTTTPLQNTLNLTPVQSWADAMEASSLEKKKNMNVQKAKEKEAEAAVPTPEEATNNPQQSESLRTELASLRKELELLRSEVKSNEMNNNKSKRGRSATRHRSRNRQQRSFSTSRGQGNKNANSQAQEVGSQDSNLLNEKPKKSRSLSRGRRRRRNSFSNPGTPLKSANPNQQQVVVSSQKREKSAVRASAEAAAKPKKGKEQSQQSQKENRNAVVAEDDFTMKCPPPGLSAPPGLASLMSNQRRKMGEGKKNRSNLAASFYNSKM